MSASPPPPSEASWLVACLCAAWCRTCDDYRAVMVEAARRHPGVRFVWVDIEDHANALDDPDGAAEDIENFPTLLIARDAEPHFFGTVTPHAGVLERLIAQTLAGELPRLTRPEARHMAQAVTALQQSSPELLRLG